MIVKITLQDIGRKFFTVDGTQYIINSYNSSSCTFLATCLSNGTFMHFKEDGSSTYFPPSGINPNYDFSHFESDVRLTADDQWYIRKSTTLVANPKKFKILTELQDGIIVYVSENTRHPTVNSGQHFNYPVMHRDQFYSNYVPYKSNYELLRETFECIFFPPLNHPTQLSTFADKADVIFRKNSRKFDLLDPNEQDFNSFYTKGRYENYIEMFIDESSHDCDPFLFFKRAESKKVPYIKGGFPTLYSTYLYEPTNKAVIAVPKNDRHVKFYYLNQFCHLGVFKNINFEDYEDCEWFNSNLRILHKQLSDFSPSSSNL